MKHTATTTTPDFKPLRPAGASEVGAIFGFTVLGNGAKKNGKLRFTISAGAQPEAWDKDEPQYLRLDACEKTRLGRLISVPKDDADARRLEVIKTTKRGLLFFPYTGKVTAIFAQYAGVCELDIEETTEDAIIFKLPEPEETV